MNSPHFLRTVIAIGLPLAAIASIILAVVYAQDQQIIRQAGNEPQVWMAESIAARLSAGAPLASFVPTIPVILETDTSPYIIFYNAQGAPLAGNASLAGTLPILPAGVLGASKGIGPVGENRLTWQPSPTVRQALVIAPFASADAKGYVVVGRSLAETEAKEKALVTRAFLGWAFTMFAILFVSLISAWLLTKRKNV